jgi:hypothetical protein
MMSDELHELLKDDDTFQEIIELLPQQKRDRSFPVMTIGNGPRWCAFVTEAVGVILAHGKPPSRPAVADVFRMGVDWVRDAVESNKILLLYGPGGKKEMESIVSWLANTASTTIGMSGFYQHLKKRQRGEIV